MSQDGYNRAEHQIRAALETFQNTLNQIWQEPDALELREEDLQKLSAVFQDQFVEAAGLLETLAGRNILSLKPGSFSFDEETGQFRLSERFQQNRQSQTVSDYLNGIVNQKEDTPFEVLNYATLGWRKRGVMNFVDKRKEKEIEKQPFENSGGIKWRPRVLLIGISFPEGENEPLTGPIDIPDTLDAPPGGIKFPPDDPPKINF